MPVCMQAQLLYQASFFDSCLVIENNAPLPNAWAGGLNSAQFSQIDVNHNSIMDLFVFDRCGNKISVFINKGTPNTPDYHYAHAYRDSFPEMSNWVLLRDYNCDGRPDIFTYTPGGIKVFKNNSPSQLQFVNVSNLLVSFFNPGTGSIYLPGTDLPAIDDIDGDGDLDILVFDVLGNYLEYHKNLSVETFGHCDSLKFALKNPCWGHFQESPANCDIFLNTCTPPNGSERIIGGDKHAGSSILTIETNGNNARELVLGDISCNSLTHLNNSGTLPNTNSPMNAFDKNFPINHGSSVKVEMELFPAAFYLDVNNDGLKDLLVSPNLYGSNATQNFHSVWYFKNTGSNNIPSFSLEQKNFLQDNMMEVGDGAFPTLHDIDGDGLIDLIVGNYNYYDSTGGRLAFYKNTGTQTMPVFTLITRNFANVPGYNLSAGNLPSMAIVPTFGDLDNDGDADMIIGDLDGNIHYFQNNNGSFVLSQPFYFSIDVGQFATPQLFDLDGDSLLDLIIGERNGNLNYYKNTGTKNAPVFTYVTDSLGKVNTTEWWDFIGFSYPSFFTLNGETHLLCGSKSGKLMYYTNIDGNLTGAFHKTDSAFMQMREGARSSVCVANLYGNDNIPELITGNLSGGLHFYQGGTTTGIRDLERNWHSYLIYPNPASDYITIQFSDKNIIGKFITYRVLNVLGQTVCSGNLSDQQQIPVNELQAGNYFLHLQYQEKPVFATGKFIIVK